ncbi:uncharacterized protein LOC112639534 [Camponotus floridanus]|uniref:uncharacterized protein LOC112639534 n=1 Tax=Camponotus floridanus TaxID=104421 RepID=UPI000DC68D62|nr:uncharacterized protein LOC112639534 [Camponotus floridanus]
MPPARRTPTPPQSIRGGPVGGQRSPLSPSAMPAVSSAPVALTTSTVTTVSCGFPVMSTGFPAGRRGTLPRPPHLPHITEMSPCLVGRRMRQEEERPLTPSRVEERRHPKEVAQGSTKGEGDSGEEDEPWRVRLGRRARRRLSGGSPGGGSPTAAGRGPVPGPPSLQAPANLNSLMRPYTVQVQRTLGCAVSGDGAGVPPQGTSVEGASGVRAGRPGGPGGVGYPSAPVGVPGVMGRRRRGHAAGGVGAGRETPAGPRSSGGGRHPRGLRRAADPSAQPYGGRSAPAAVAGLRRRRRVAARDVLVGRAEAVTSIADLEEFAALGRGFLRGGGIGEG